MTDASEDHEGTVSNGGRTITNLRFADDIDDLAGEDENWQNWLSVLTKPPQPMAWRSVPRRPNWWQTTPMASTQRLNEMDRSLRQSQASSIWAQCMTDEGSKPEILSSIAQTTEESTRLKPVWNDRSISLSSKIRLMRSLVTSIFLHACESWTVPSHYFKEECKAWSWGATARYCASHTKT